MIIVRLYNDNSHRSDDMFLLEILLTILIFAFIILLVALALALAIPLALLYLVYWILFKSWRPSKRTPKKRHGVGKDIVSNKTKEVKRIVEESMKSSTEKD